MTDTISEGLTDKRIQAAIKFSSEAQHTDQSIKLNREDIEKQAKGKTPFERMKNEMKGWIEQVANKVSSKEPSAKVFQGAEQRLYVFMKNTAEDPEKSDQLENWIGQMDPLVAYKVKTADGSVADTLIRRSSKIDQLNSPPAQKTSVDRSNPFLFSNDGKNFTLNATDDFNQDKETNQIAVSVATEQFLKILEGKEKVMVSFDRDGVTIPIHDSQRGLILVTCSYEQYQQLEQEARTTESTYNQVMETFRLRLDQPKTEQRNDPSIDILIRKAQQEKVWIRREDTAKLPDNYVRLYRGVKPIPPLAIETEFLAPLTNQEHKIFDGIMDKSLKHGAESLTEAEKRVLREGKRLVRKLDRIYADSFEAAQNYAENGVVYYIDVPKTETDEWRAGNGMGETPLVVPFEVAKNAKVMAVGSALKTDIFLGEPKNEKISDN